MLQGIQIYNLVTELSSFILTVADQISIHKKIEPFSWESGT